MNEIEDVNVVGKKKRGRRKNTGSIQMEKSGIYTMRYCANGKRFSKSTGTEDKDEAERMLVEWVAQIQREQFAVVPSSVPTPHPTNDNNNLPALMRQATQMPCAEQAKKYEAFQQMQSLMSQMFGDQSKKPVLKLEDGFTVYLASPRRRDNDQLTLQSKQSHWQRFVKWINANFPDIQNVFDINQSVITTWLAANAQIYCGGTYNGRLCVIREMMMVMHQEYGLHFGVFDGVKQKSEDRHTRREFTNAELDRIVDAAIAEGDEYRKLFAIGIYTGLRLGDCCRLMWGNCLMDEGVIQIVPHKTRKHTKGKPVTIPIHPILMSIFMETPPSEQTGPVLPEINKLYLGTRWRLSMALAKIWKGAGIQTSIQIEGRRHRTPDAGFHSLRHTFVSNACNAGVPIAIVQSIVGHMSSSMTRHYYHESLNGLKQAIAAMPVIDKIRNRPTTIDYNDVQIVPDGVPIPKTTDVVDVTDVPDVTITNP